MRGRKAEIAREEKKREREKENESGWEARGRGVWEEREEREGAFRFLRRGERERD